MDTKPGGHVEGIATEAKARVDALFGSYGSKPAPALTFAAENVADRTKIAGDPFDMVRYFIRALTPRCRTCGRRTIRSRTRRQRR